MKVRYIRESMTGSNSNTGCHWCEIQAINYEGVNVALNKTVTCEGGSYEKGTLDMITNGNITVDDYVYFRNDAQNTISVTVDLENIEELDNIRVWHYYGGGRTYHNILLETSLDGIKWVEVFDSNKKGEYVEVEEGKTHKLKDDRLPLLNENSSLSEVTYFYEKYIEQDISNKEFLKNVLTSKEIECNDDKMLSLINKVGNIEIGKKWAIGNSENTKELYAVKFHSSTFKRNCHLIHLPVLDFEPSCIIAIAYNSGYTPPVYEYVIFTKQLGFDFIGSGIVHPVNSANVTGCMFDANDANIRLVNPFILPTDLINMQINFTWIAFE